MATGWNLGFLFCDFYWLVYYRATILIVSLFFVNLDPDYPVRHFSFYYQRDFEVFIPNFYHRTKNNCFEFYWFGWPDIFSFKNRIYSTNVDRKMLKSISTEPEFLFDASSKSSVRIISAYQVNLFYVWTVFYHLDVISSLFQRDFKLCCLRFIDQLLSRNVLKPIRIITYDFCDINLQRVFYRDNLCWRGKNG